MVKKNIERKIPTKNYLIAAIIILAVIGLTFYIFKWVSVVNEEKLSKSYLVSSNTIVHEIKDIDELNDVFLEMPSEYFVYISYTNDKDVYELEKELKDLIIEYGLKDYFYYINTTEMKNDKDYLSKISESLAIEKSELSKIPTIIMFRDGKIVTDGVVKREDEQMIKASDFAKLLEIKEIKKVSR